MKNSIKKNLEITICICIGIIFFTSCQQVEENIKQPNKNQSHAAFISMENDKGLSDYWYQGKAEVSTYVLEQNRYGNIHPGNAILIQVTEDFLTDKQVKNERYTNPNSIPILKTNLIKRFVTGVYDYSIMLSVFTPAKGGIENYTEKITLSSQDWCGQSFLQLNKKKKGFQLSQFSYFEKEGDTKSMLPLTLSEDEIFNRLRINPSLLPVGEIQIIPSLSSSRLNHSDLNSEQATAEMLKGNAEGNSIEEWSTYSIKYKASERHLKITFSKKSPYSIQGWEETEIASNGKTLTTKAVLKARELRPYWKEHNPEHRVLREGLGL